MEGMSGEVNQGRLERITREKLKINPFIFDSFAFIYFTFKWNKILELLDCLW